MLYISPRRTEAALPECLESDGGRTEHRVGSNRVAPTRNQDRISANLEDGVLTLTLPKAKAARPRKIAIG